MFIFYTKTNLKWTYLLQRCFISAKHHKSKLKWDFSLKCNYVSWAEICEWEKEETNKYFGYFFPFFQFIKCAVIDVKISHTHGVDK